MPIDRVAIKFYANADIGDLTPAIPVFHRWIQEQVLLDLPLDVADYRHVPSGPGVVLIGCEADIGLDRHEGPLGVIYNRKQALAGSDAQRLEQCLRLAVQAALRLAGEGLGLDFDGSRLRIVFNDRLQQPNTDAGLAAVQPAIEAAVQAVFGAGAEILVDRDREDPRTRLIAHVGLSGAAPLAGIAAAIA